ncbi:arabinofuranosyltransferase [Pseudonocardia acidicola]|uniref:arabinofuranosyltransferase n=1 Tax=Pseudonocardia acidicola TaxID=2724939 RepID=UPI003083EF79
MSLLAARPSGRVPGQGVVPRGEVSVDSGCCLVRRPAGAFLCESVGAVVTAGLVSGAAQFAIGRLHIPFPSNVPSALFVPAAVVLLAGILALAATGRREWSRWATLGAWSALSCLSTLALALPLQGTRFYLGGAAVDQEFRLQFMTRMASSPRLADMNYADLPSYYPSGWFWVGGRFADLLGIPGWQAYKPFSIATMALAAAMSFTLWGLVLPRASALLAALATSIAGLQVTGSVAASPVSEPYSWLLVAMLPPVAVLAWHVLSCRARRHWGLLLGVGGFLGLCGAVYTLFLGFTAVLVLVLATVSGLSRRVRWGALVLRVLVIAVAALPLALLQWAPYLLAWAGSGMPGTAAARFLPAGGAVVPLPMLQVSVFGALCLAGVVWMVVALRRSAVAQGLAALAATCYAWYGLSMLALAVGQTLLAFRLEPVLDAVFAVAGVLGLLEALGTVPGLLPARHVRPALAAAPVLAVAAALALVQTVPARLGNGDAYANYYPSGTTALGARDPTQPGRWNEQLADTIGQMTGKPPQDLVLLTTYTGLFAFWPFHGFQALTAHYANPLGDFAGRRSEIERWARTTSPRQLAAELDASPHRAPTVFVLRPQDGTLHMTLSRDVFPRDPNVEFYDVQFAPAVFSGPIFTTRTVGPFVVAVRR